MSGALSHCLSTECMRTMVLIAFAGRRDPHAAESRNALGSLQFYMWARSTIRKQCSSFALIDVSRKHKTAVHVLVSSPSRQLVTSNW
jgi:hypothetical protein